MSMCAGVCVCVCACVCVCERETLCVCVGGAAVNWSMKAECESLGVVWSLSRITHTHTCTRSFHTEAEKKRTYRPTMFPRS